MFSTLLHVCFNFMKMKLKISALFWFCFLRSSARARVPLLPVSSLRVFLAPSLITGPAVINIRTHTSVRAGRLPVGSEEILHNGAHVTQHFFSFLHFFFMCVCMYTSFFVPLPPMQGNKIPSVSVAFFSPKSRHTCTHTTSIMVLSTAAIHTHTHTHTHTHIHMHIYTYIHTYIYINNGTFHFRIHMGRCGLTLGLR